MTELTAAVGEGERGDDGLAAAYRSHIRTDVFDDAEKLVAGAGAGLLVRYPAVGPEVRATNAGVHDTNDRVGWLLDAWIRDVFDPHVTGTVEDRRAHERRGYPLASGPAARTF